MIKIGLVYKRGGAYNREDVQSIVRQCKAHIPGAPIEILTDDLLPFEGCESIPLKHNLDGWWSKMELFAPEREGHVLYFDLDTIVLRPPKRLLAAVMQAKSLWMLSDFYYPENPASGVMFIHTSCRGPIWNHWQAHCDDLMKRHHGDQEAIAECYRADPIRFQREVHNAVMSWKVSDAIYELYDDVAYREILCFHGTPKPVDIKGHSIIRKYGMRRDNLKTKAPRFYQIANRQDHAWIKIAEESKETLIKGGLNPEHLPSIEGENIQKSLNFLGLKSCELGQGVSKLLEHPYQGNLREGQLGCVVAHALAWGKVFETNEPAIILEHDAHLIGSIDAMQPIAEGVTSLIDHAWDSMDIPHINQLWIESPAHGCLDYQCLPTSAAYAITPGAAEKLLDALKIGIDQPLDVTVNQAIVQLYQGPKIFREKRFLGQDNPDWKTRDESHPSMVMVEPASTESGTLAGCYFTSTSDPIRGGTLGSGLSDYVSEWAKRGLEFGSEVVLFHDGIQGIETIAAMGCKCVHVDRPNISAVADRWMIYEQFLLTKEPGDKVFFTDVGDCVMASSPWAAMREGELYIGSETDMPKGSPEWLHECAMEFINAGTMDRERWDKILTKAKERKFVYNPGILGGAVSCVSDFVSDMARFSRTAKVFDMRDMSAANYILSRKFATTLITGNSHLPVHSDYRKFETDRKDVWFIHK